MMTILSQILIILAIITVLVAVFLINFYRDPKRKIPEGSNIVSPADGKVISIIKADKKEVKVNKGLLGKVNTLTKDVAKECYIVSIFMNPLDVHVNRVPVDGEIISIKHEKGKFFMAYDLEKSLLNEKNEVLMKNKKLGGIKVIQIAGFLARRIICRVKEKEKVKKGQRFGNIALGSQATLIFPSAKTRLRVRKGQKVRAGSSIIADIE